MMKRPRSFISTLIVLLSLAFVPLGLTVNAHDANAGGMPRVMDPRAGDPTEPDDGPLPDNSGSGGESDYTTRTPNKYWFPTSSSNGINSQGVFMILWRSLHSWIERR
jgi:hypothetical protein